MGRLLQQPDLIASCYLDCRLVIFSTTALQIIKINTQIIRSTSIDGQRPRLAYGLNTKREIDLVMMYAIVNAMIGFALGRIDVAPL